MAKTIRIDEDVIVLDKITAVTTGAYSLDDPMLGGKLEIYLLGENESIEYEFDDSRKAETLRDLIQKELEKINETGN